MSIDAHATAGSALARAPARGTGDAWRVIVLNDNHNTFEGVAFALASDASRASTTTRAWRSRPRSTRPARRSCGRATQELAELYHAQLEGYGLTMAPLERMRRRRRHPPRLRRVHAAATPRALFEVIAEDAVWRVPGTTPVVARVPRPRRDLRALPRDAPAHRRHVPERAALGARRRRARRRGLPRARHAARARDRHRPGAADHAARRALAGDRRRADRPAGVRGVLGLRRRRRRRRNDPVTHAVQARLRRG